MKYKISDNDFIKIVKESTSIRQVLCKMGHAPLGGNYRTVKKRAEKLNLDLSHFLGQASRRGTIIGPKRALSDYISGKCEISSCALKKRLIKEGYFSERCSNCNLEEWLGKKIPLELDHIDGNSKNNDLTNLRLLCPNCHTLTPTTYRRGKTSLCKETKLAKKLNKAKEFKTFICKYCKEPFKRDRKEYKNIYCCLKCAAMDSRKCAWPSKEELLQLINTTSFVKIGKIFGVSDNTIRKWASLYEIDFKRNRKRTKIS